MNSAFARALHASGPMPEHADPMALYGRFIGDWSMDARVHADDGSEHHARGEIHFGWVLDGRAIQDVWTLPGFFAGTTLRVYDPGIDAWHVLWSDPLKQYYCRQTARAHGEDIVQEGHNNVGEAVRWRFVEIEPDRFRWLGERRRDGEPDWQLQADFAVRRAAH